MGGGLRIHVLLLMVFAFFILPAKAAEALPQRRFVCC